MNPSHTAQATEGNEDETLGEATPESRIVKHKSIFAGKNPIGFQDLDFEVVREIKYSNA